MVEKMIALFEEYRASFGLGDQEYLDQQCEFEDQFKHLICEVKGHKLGPDHCNHPEHDICYRCGELASELGFVRSEPKDGQYEYLKVAFSPGMFSGSRR